jgi:hypothetical protein
MKEILRLLNSRPFLAKCPPASLVAVSAGYCQRALVDESGMIIKHVEHTVGHKMAAVLGMPCAIPPRNSNGSTRMMTSLNLFAQALPSIAIDFELWLCNTLTVPCMIVTVCYTVILEHT